MGIITRNIGNLPYNLLEKRDNMQYHKSCILCKNNLPFKMPRDIVEAAIDQKLIIFAGAGVSTESKTVLPGTFYEDICRQLKLKPNPTKYPFPQLMTKYCKKFG